MPHFLHLTNSPIKLYVFTLIFSFAGYSVIKNTPKVEQDTEILSIFAITPIFNLHERGNLSVTYQPTNSRKEIFRRFN